MIYDPLSPEPVEVPKGMPSLFGDDFNEKWWEQEWLDMPEFVQQDMEPLQHIVVNFEFFEDVKEFGKLIGQNVSSKTNSLWFPKQDRIEPKNFLYINET